jgi:5-methylcytosine-specific restriction endonuclease McrBC regulatory subunit McrC
LARLPIYGIRNLEIIRVPERGYTDISSNIWQSLASSIEFWRLVEKEIIKVSNPTSSSVRLNGTCYVGRAVFDNVTLEVHEKIIGSLKNLIKFASYETFKIENIPSSSSEFGQLIVFLIQEFLKQLGKYVTIGREFRFIKKHDSGPIICGKLDINRTVLLRARGLRHIAAYQKNELTRSTYFNRIMRAALHEIESISRMFELPRYYLSNSRSLSMIFDDCRDAEVLYGERTILVLEAQRMLRQNMLNELKKDLLALASVILSRESFEVSRQVDKIIPITWFINLENLFEASVRIILQKILSHSLIVISGKKMPAAIFNNSFERYNAEPDLVLRLENDVIAVGDVKYKTWTGYASSSDLYQLLVHSSAYKTDNCFLIFPHNEFEYRYIGKSATGQNTWFFAIDVFNLERDIKILLEILASKIIRLSEIIH